MDMLEIIKSLITEVGFPIAACVCLYIQNTKLSNTLGELNTTLSTMNERISDIENKIS